MWLTLAILQDVHAVFGAASTNPEGGSFSLIGIQIIVSVWCGMGMGYLKPSNGSRKNQKLSGGEGVHDGIGGPLRADALKSF